MRTLTETASAELLPVFADANDLIPQLALLPSWRRIVVFSAPLVPYPNAVLLVRPELAGEVATQLAALVGATEVMDPREFFARGYMRQVRRVGVLYNFVDELKLTIFARI